MTDTSLPEQHILLHYPCYVTFNEWAITVTLGHPEDMNQITLETAERVCLLALYFVTFGCVH